MNYYSTFALLRAIPCSQEAGDAFIALLKADNDRNCNNDDGPCNLEAECDGRVLHVFSGDGECADPCLADSATMEALGKIIGDAGLEYADFGMAYTSPKMRESSQGGHYGRITKAGEVVIWDFAAVRRSTYITDVEVDGEILEIHRDPISGAMFGVNAEFVDQVDDTIFSPYNPGRIRLQDPDKK